MISTGKKLFQLSIQQWCHVSSYHCTSSLWPHVLPLCKHRYRQAHTRQGNRECKGSLQPGHVCNHDSSDILRMERGSKLRRTRGHDKRRTDVGGAGYHASEQSVGECRLAS